MAETMPTPADLARLREILAGLPREWGAQVQGEILESLPALLAAVERAAGLERLVQQWRFSQHAPRCPCKLCVRTGEEISLPYYPDGGREDNKQ